MGMILQCLPPAEAARVLVDLANLRGGPDNITVIIVRVKGPLTTGGQQGQPSPATPSAPVPPDPSRNVDDSGRTGRDRAGAVGDGAALAGVGQLGGGRPSAR